MMKLVKLYTVKPAAKTTFLEWSYVKQGQYEYLQRLLDLFLHVFNNEEPCVLCDQMTNFNRLQNFKPSCIFEWPLIYKKKKLQVSPCFLNRHSAQMVNYNKKN